MKIADAFSGPGASRRDVLIGGASFVVATKPQRRNRPTLALMTKR
jgi:hypothetical protein